jgi:hypothetical protein
MDQNNVSFKLGIPFYIGIASIANGLETYHIHLSSITGTNRARLYSHPIMKKY